MSNDRVTLVRSDDKAELTCGCIILLLWVAGVIGIGAVIVHFLIKLW